MTITSLNQAEVTKALKTFLAERADLSTDGSGNAGMIKVGVDEAPPPDEDDATLTQIDYAMGTARPYLVLSSRPAGGLTEARGSFIGGGQSSQSFTYAIAAVSVDPDVAVELATIAAARVCDVDPATGQYRELIPIDGHLLSHRERQGSGGTTRVGSLHQHIELIALDVSIDLDQ